MPVTVDRRGRARWLADCSPATLADALQTVVPGLGRRSIEMSVPAVAGDPRWWSSTAVIDGEFVAKFAWSRPAARRVAHEIGVLAALAGTPFRPEVVAAGTDPVLLVTRRVSGASLFEVVDSIDRDGAGRQLATFLAALHDPATRARVERAVGRLPAARRGPQHPASTRILRDRFTTPWYDWVDATLAPRRRHVLVHADLHGDNQVWVGDRLRLVVDFETASAAEPEYDLRAFPGTGPGVELLIATVRHYRRLTGRDLALDRVMAWHVRTALGDVLWRSEAGVPLPDHRTEAEWIDDLAARFDRLGIDPGRHR